MAEVRKNQGLTQKELSQNSGISIRTIQNYECGHRDIDKAPLMHLVALADALGIKFYELLSSEIKEKIKQNLKE